MHDEAQRKSNERPLDVWRCKIIFANPYRFVHEALKTFERDLH